MNTEQEFQTISGLLERGTFQLKGQFVYSSNYTFLVDVEDTNSIERIQAVYKPARGERPLWDFPEDTLAHRETAAYLVSEALGWHFVPPTVFREDGPLGAGSLQLFIRHDPEHHFFNFSREECGLLRQVVMFDLLINNADRKSGHLLIDERKKMWLIDHGICFHAEEKLRTVIWNYAGQRIPARLRNDVADFLKRLSEEDELRNRLENHLSDLEIDALASRASRLSGLKTFPLPPNDRPAYPWPPV